MTSSATRTMGSAVNMIDASALESLEAINHRLKRSHFLEELTGKVHLTQFDAVSSINPDLANSTREAKKL